MPWGSTTAPQHPIETSVSIDPPLVLRRLLAVIVLFGMLHLAAMPIYVDGMKAADGAFVRAGRLFMLQSERSIPSWFSIALIALNMLLLVLCAAASRRSRAESPGPWLSLAALFCLLSLDEMLSLHERVGSLIGLRFGIGGTSGGGFLTFPWVIAGAIFTAVVGLAFLGFLRRLPRRTAKLFVLSGAVYAGAALGIEVIEAYTVSEIGMGAIYYVEVLVEETMEMLGQALFAFALLDHLARSRISFVIGAPVTAPATQTLVCAPPGTQALPGIVSTRQ